MCILHSSPRNFIQFFDNMTQINCYMYCYLCILVGFMVDCGGCGAFTGLCGCCERYVQPCLTAAATIELRVAIIDMVTMFECDFR